MIRFIRRRGWSWRGCESIIRAKKSRGWSGQLQLTKIRLVMANCLLIFKERMIHRHLSGNYIILNSPFLRDLLLKNRRHEIQPSIFIVPNILGSKLLRLRGSPCLIRLDSFKITYSSIGCKILRPLSPTLWGKSIESLRNLPPIRTWTRTLSYVLLARGPLPHTSASQATLSHLRVTTT